MMLSGCLIGFNWIFLFEAYNYTSVARATLSYNMQAIIVILISPLVLKEHLGIRKLICAAFAVFGMVLVSGALSQDAAGGSALGIGLGLLGAFTYAIVVILNKRIFIGNSYFKAFVQMVCASAAVLPYLFFKQEMKIVISDGRAFILILIMGVVHTGLAYILYFSAIQRLKGQSSAMLSYIDPVSALIFSVIFLGESISPLSLLGAVMIIGASLAAEFRD